MTECVLQLLPPTQYVTLEHDWNTYFYIFTRICYWDITDEKLVPTTNKKKKDKQQQLVLASYTRSLTLVILARSKKLKLHCLSISSSEDVK